MHDRHAASSLAQDRAVGWSGEVMGAKLEKLFTPAIVARTRPASSSSISKVAVVAVVFIGIDKADTVGVDIQAGGPSVVE